MLTLVDYSAKSFAVTGDTIAAKNQLKAAGGRFNARLSCGPGWIFSKKDAESVREIIKAHNLGALSEVAQAVSASMKDAGKGRKKGTDTLNGARVYVGTYGAYNSGSLRGAWLTLADYANKGEFLAACRKLHASEHEPEFMFQDWENVPSWMISESWIDGALWDAAPVEDEQPATQSREYIRAALEKVLTPGRDLDYYTKETAVIVEDGERIFRIKKPTIETRFCHPDEPDDEAREWLKRCRTYEFFAGENLAELDRLVELLDGDVSGDLSGLFVFREAYLGTWSFGKNADRYYLTEDSKAEPMTDATRAKLLKGAKAARAAFEKRLRAWWKRYGADKLHCWTYWRDA